ncbi:hypothetical protein ACIRD4_11880 [Streptomyces clavifer]|uniref:hypothetical protein n=1 Tax=Streptomyces clavifer TaxID=68188 RepID=UPI003819DCA9
MSLETVAGRFRLRGAIDSGNMGEVHRAEDLQESDRAAGRLVAVKLILCHGSGAVVDTRADVKAKYGTYRTKDLILAGYDRMAAADLTLENPLVDGENYTSTLTPPPGHGPRHPHA